MPNFGWKLLIYLCIIGGTTQAFNAGKAATAFQDVSNLKQCPHPKTSFRKSQNRMVVEGVSQNLVHKSADQIWQQIRSRPNSFARWDISFLLIVSAMVSKNLNPKMLAEQRQSAMDHHAEVLKNFKEYPRKYRLVGYLIHDSIAYGIAYGILGTFGFFPVLLTNISLYTIFPILRKMRHIGSYKALKFIETIYSKPVSIVRSAWEDVKGKVEAQS